MFKLDKEITDLLNDYYDLFDEDGVLIEGKDDEEKKIKFQLEEKQNKIDDLKIFILEKRSDNIGNIQSINLEIERLTKLKQSQEKQNIQSENFLKHLFGKLDKPIIFDNYKIGYTKSKSTVIENKDLIPSKFKIIEVKEVEKIPLADIKKAIEDGEEVPGAKIQENLKFYIK